jgi:hypothetical protein
MMSVWLRVRVIYELMSPIVHIAPDVDFYGWSGNSTSIEPLPRLDQRNRQDGSSLTSVGLRTLRSVISVLPDTLHAF